jgi:erythromycin esterase-like protein
MSRAFAALRIAAVAGVALSPASGLAQTGRACAARTQVVERLAERFGETLQSVGVDAGGGLVELFASRDTGTWTILATNPDGSTCLVASGSTWESLAPLRRPGQAA